MTGLSLESLLVELAEVPGASGREAGVAAAIAGRLNAAGIETRFDRLGNLYATILSGQPGAKPTLLLSAHMDTIGLVVRDVDEHGVVRILPIGGVNRRTLLGLEVWIHGKERVFGVVGATPPHLTTPAERKKVAPWEQFFVDTGLGASEVRALVRPGDWITFATAPVRLGNGRLSSPGLDNRAGVAAVLWSGLRLAASRAALPVDVVLCFTVQEELGTRGAAAAEPAPLPDAAVVVDVGFGDMPGVKPRDSIGFGSGPALTSGPNIHPGVRRYLAAVAERLGVRVQDEVMAGSSGTDAWELQVAGVGIPSAVVSIPLRYMHSTVEAVNLADLEQAARLLEAACIEADAAEVWGWSGGPVAREVE